MTINEIKSKVGELNSAWEEFKHTNNKRLEELEHKGSVDPMLQNKLDRLNEVMDSTNKKLEMLEIRQKRPNIMEYKTGYEDRAYKKAFDEFLRFGDNTKLRHMQKKALGDYDSIGFTSPNDESNGSNLIRPAMSEYIDLYSKDTEPMFDLVTRNYSKKNATNFITDTDKIHAQWNASGTSIAGGTAFSGADNIEQFVSHPITKAMLFCNIHVNINVINDPIIDLEQFLVDAVARAFAHARTKGILFGDGDTAADKIPMKGLNKSIIQPHQIPVTGTNDKIPNGSGGTKEPTDNPEKIQLDISNITYDDVLKLYYSLDDQYIKNASFVMSKEVLTQVRTLKDTAGHYLWSPSSAAIPQDTILGVPVARVQDMDNVANQTTGKKKILMYLGDFKRAYYLTLNPGIEVIRDPYSNQPSVNFLISQFTGGDAIDNNSYSALIGAQALV